MCYYCRASKEDKQTINEEFIKHILNTYSETVFRISFLRTKNRPDAEDITQDVFLSLLTPPPFNDEEHIKAWVIRTTINKCKNFSRFRRKNSAIPLETVSYNLNSKPLKEEYLDLADAFQKLPKNDQSILYLFYYEDCTAKEISDILTIKQSAVFMRLNRAREKLKKLLNYKETDHENFD